MCIRLCGDMTDFQVNQRYRRMTGAHRLAVINEVIHIPVDVSVIFRSFFVLFLFCGIFLDLLGLCTE